MKKLKLRNWVKVVITIVLIITSIIVYKNLGNVGNITNQRNLQEFLGIFGWAWLFSQAFILSAIWE